MKSKLDSGLESLGIIPTDLQWRQLNTYMNEIELWNSRLNLVSIKDREELEVRHILDCLAGIDIIRAIEGRTIADIGSGAGLPGMLLAIFLEDRNFTLVERSGKKAGFLRSTAALLDIVDRVEVLDRDLKNINREFDIVVLRAFRDFGEFVDQLRGVTSRGGRIAAYKGKISTIRNDLETAGIGAGEAEVRKLNVPGLEEERHLLLLRV